MSDPVENIDIDDPIESQSTQVNPEDRGVIVFYCKDCNKIVEAQKVGIKYVYKCSKCKGKNVAFGTEASIKKFFHIPENPLNK